MSEINRHLDEPLQSESLNEIDIISYRWLNVSIRYLPWALFAYAIINYLFFPPQQSLDKTRLDALHWTGFVAAGLVIIVFGIVFKKASSVLNMLWLGGVFPVREKIKVESLSLRIERMANHPVWNVMITIAFLGFTAFFTFQSCSSEGVSATGLDMFFCNYHVSPVRTSKSIVELVTIFFLTLFIWRLMVVAWNIGKLGKALDLTIKWNHPDERRTIPNWYSFFLDCGNFCYWRNVSWWMADRLPIF